MIRIQKTRKRIFIVLNLFLFSSLTFASSIDTLKYGSFGTVLIYKPASSAKAVVLFNSGSSGWDKSLSGMAKNLVADGAIVVGIDTRQYLKKLKKQGVKCYYPAGDFEELSMMLQKQYKLNQYLKPILVGYSTGATLVYGTLAQAPANTFKGAIALAFSPKIESNKPLCRGSGLKIHALTPGRSYYLEASEKLTAPFIILQDAKDQEFSLSETRQYMKAVNTGQLVELPELANSIPLSSGWLQELLAAYNKILKAPSFAEQKSAQNTLLQSQKLIPLAGDFPVIAIPTAVKDTLPMVFFISGDGGWTSFDNSLGEALAAKGMPVVGLDAQKYFWNAKSPSETTLAVTKAIEHFMQQWNKKKFILAGYSFGACIVPFIGERLPENLKETLVGIYSLSPDETADFEIHISDMLSIGSSRDSYKVTDEIKKVKSLHPVCIFGLEESAKTRTLFSEAGAKIITLPGDHHYNDNPAAAADAIIQELMRK
jgi:type IV secretory pathway VirJ component